MKSSPITVVATTASRRWKITVAALVAVVIAGLSAYGFGLDREGFPPVNTPVSVVTGTYFVDDAESVDADVVAPLVAAFAGVADVEDVFSEARSSSFGITVQFDDTVSSAVGTQRLVDLGVEIDPSIADSVTIDYRPINAAKLAGRYDAIVAIVGPAGADASALQEQAVAVAESLQTDPDIELAEVRDLVTEQIDPATGEPERRTTRFTRVAFGPDGYREAITIGLIRPEATDLDVIGFSDRVESLLSDPQLPLDDGFTADVTADFATGVRQQLSSLTSNLLTGLAAVALVSLLLIGWRVAVMTAGFMALVLMGALIGLWTTGYTLNTITLFGLILTLGLLVDDAIVISESIDANRHDPDVDPDVDGDDESIGVIRRAIDRVGSASFAGTLTTVVVFSPMLFIGGILGEFIRPIPTTVVITLLISFVFSIVFIPTMARLFLLRGSGTPNPVIRAEQAVARAAGRLAGYPSGNGWKGVATGAALVGLAIVAVLGGGRIAGGLGFSIFPAGKDAASIQVVSEFPPGTTIEQAQERSARVDEVVVDVLGDELVRSQYLRGNERLTDTFVDLSPIGSRSTTAPEFVERIEERVATIEGIRITVGISENGPPVLEFPFAAQIEVDDSSVAEGQALAERLRDELRGVRLDVGGDTVTITDAIVSTDGLISRIDGQRVIEVRAKYDEDNGISGILNATEQYVVDNVDSSLPIGFDFGLESDNQDDFAALGVAGIVALVLMLLLITIQFRSLAQSLLIFLAIPFGFLGVASALSLTDNPFSFLAAVGFIALIGVAVNNTILLVDAANQERRDGATAGEAIRSAVTSRFRPLVATTLTTIVGLLPLSISDPFWESLGFTLMGGLLTSTFLVLVSFPAFYLALEAVRTPVRNVVRRWRGRPEIA